MKYNKLKKYSQKLKGLLFSDAVVALQISTDSV